MDATGKALSIEGLFVYSEEPEATERRFPGRFAQRNIGSMAKPNSLVAPWEDRRDP